MTLFLVTIDSNLIIILNFMNDFILFAGAQGFTDTSFIGGTDVDSEGDQSSLIMLMISFLIIIR